jgi:hypothetical protein
MGPEVFGAGRKGNMTVLCLSLKNEIIQMSGPILEKEVIRGP